MAVEVTGLSPGELQQFRDALAQGRKPKVQFTASAGQIAGQIGQVVELTDPAVSDEWVVVRFGRDELPFSPGDLRVAPKGAAGRRPAAPAAPPPPAAPAPEFVIDRPPPPPRRNEDHVSDPAPAPAPAAPAPRRSTAKNARPKPAPGLTVTLAYADSEWTVAAAQGAKTLAKPYVIKPAEALKIVQLVDVPGVHEAVEQIISAERAEAEQQAERLRAELAEIEARLKELGDAR